LNITSIESLIALFRQTIASFRSLYVLLLAIMPSPLTPISMDNTIPPNKRQKTRAERLSAAQWDLIKPTVIEHYDKDKQSNTLDQTIVAVGEKHGFSPKYFFFFFFFLVLIYLIFFG
jgi:hypothetical protein